MRNSWSFKLLDKSWKETKEYQIENLDNYIDELLNSLTFNFMYQYEIDLEDKFPTFGNTNFIEYTQIANVICTRYELLKKLSVLELSVNEDGSENEELMTKFKAYLKRGILTNMDASFEPKIEEENIRMENDVNMLKILAKRYPNYQELINQ